MSAIHTLSFAASAFDLLAWFGRRVTGGCSFLQRTIVQQDDIKACMAVSGKTVRGRQRRGKSI
jgi:hypothetical protein